MNDLKGGLQRALDSALMSGETVTEAIHMNYGEGLVLTDRRLLVLKAGILKAGLGSKAISFRLSQISSIEHRRGPLGGHVKILAAGVLESGGLGDAFMRNSKRENVVTYQSPRLRSRIEELIRGAELLIYDADKR